MRNEIIDVLKYTFYNNTYTNCLPYIGVMFATVRRFLMAKKLRNIDNQLKELIKESVSDSSSLNANCFIAAAQEVGRSQNAL